MAEKRVTTVTDRFTIDCSYCGFITSRTRLAEAQRATQNLKLTHSSPEEKLTVFDRMAKKGMCDTWDVDGHCIHRKEW